MLSRLIKNTIFSKRIYSLLLVAFCVSTQFVFSANTLAQSNQSNVIFEANFNNSLDDFLGDGRVYMSNSGVMLRGSRYDGGSLISPPISTLGSESLEISYNRQVSRLSSGENFKSEISVDGVNYTELETVQSATGNITLDLPSDYENQQQIYLRFSLAGNSYFDLATLSYLKISSQNSDCSGSDCCDDCCSGCDDEPLPESSVYDDGPFNVSVKRFTGPRRRGQAYYPSNMGEIIEKHPVVFLSRDAGSRSTDYEMLLRRLASHGFFVYTERATSSANEIDNFVDWATEQIFLSNEWIAGKIDLYNIAIVGHGEGGTAIFKKSAKGRAYTRISIAGAPSAERIPPVITSSYFISGSDDQAVSGLENHFYNSEATAFFSIIDNASGFKTVEKATPAITSWLKWFLLRGLKNREDFILPDCEFCSGDFESQYNERFERVFIDN